MSKVLQLAITQKMDALSPLCHWTYDWHSKDREPPTEFQRFCRRQWARLYQKYKKGEKRMSETGLTDKLEKSPNRPRGLKITSPNEKLIKIAYVIIEQNNKILEINNVLVQKLLIFDQRLM